MKINIEIKANGIHSFARVDIYEAKSRDLGLVIAILKETDKYNEEEINNA